MAIRIQKRRCGTFYPIDSQNFFRKIFHISCEKILQEDSDEENTQKEKWVLALSKKMTKNVPEEHKEYVKGFLFELFKYERR